MSHLLLKTLALLLGNLKPEEFSVGIIFNVKNRDMNDIHNNIGNIYDTQKQFDANNKNKFFAEIKNPGSNTWNKSHGKSIVPNWSNHERFKSTYNINNNNNNINKVYPRNKNSHNPLGSFWCDIKNIDKLKNRLPGSPKLKIIQHQDFPENLNNYYSPCWTEPQNIDKQLNWPNKGNNHPSSQKPKTINNLHYYHPTWIYPQKIENKDSSPSEVIGEKSNSVNDLPDLRNDKINYNNSVLGYFQKKENLPKYEGFMEYVNDLIDPITENSIYDNTETNNIPRHPYLNVNNPTNPGNLRNYTKSALTDSSNIPKWLHTISFEGTSNSLKVAFSEKNYNSTSNVTQKMEIKPNWPKEDIFLESRNPKINDQAFPENLNIDHSIARNDPLKNGTLSKSTNDSIPSSSNSNLNGHLISENQKNYDSPSWYDLVHSNIENSKNYYPASSYMQKEEEVSIWPNKKNVLGIKTSNQALLINNSNTYDNPASNDEHKLINHSWSNNERDLYSAMVNVKDLTHKINKNNNINNFTSSVAQNKEKLFSWPKKEIYIPDPTIVAYKNFKIDKPDWNSSQKTTKDPIWNYQPRFKTLPSQPSRNWNFPDRNDQGKYRSVSNANVNKGPLLINAAWKDNKKIQDRPNLAILDARSESRDYSKTNDNYMSFAKDNVAHNWNDYNWDNQGTSIGNMKRHLNKTQSYENIHNGDAGWNYYQTPKDNLSNSFKINMQTINVNNKTHSNPKWYSALPDKQYFTDGPILGLQSPIINRAQNYNAPIKSKNKDVLIKNNQLYVINPQPNKNEIPNRNTQQKNIYGSKKPIRPNRISLETTRVLPSMANQYNVASNQGFKLYPPSSQIIRYTDIPNTNGPLINQRNVDHFYSKDNNQSSSKIINPITPGLEDKNPLRPIWIRQQEIENSPILFNQDIPKVNIKTNLGISSTPIAENRKTTNFNERFVVKNSSNYFPKVYNTRIKSPHEIFPTTAEDDDKDIKFSSSNAQKLEHFPLSSGRDKINQKPKTFKSTNKSTINSDVLPSNNLFDPKNHNTITQDDRVNKEIDPSAQNLNNLQSNELLRTLFSKRGSQDEIPRCMLDYLTRNKNIMDQLVNILA